MNHRYERIPKASPIACLRNFLSRYFPTCNNKYIQLDQGGEISNNQVVNNLLQSFGCTLYPTGYYTSHKNGSVKRSYRTLSNSIQNMLTISNLDIK